MTTSAGFLHQAVKMIFVIGKLYLYLYCITCSKFTIETLEQGVKYVQS